jgi:H+-transporting ATP synthase F0 complex subunit s
MRLQIGIVRKLLSTQRCAYVNEATQTRGFYRILATIPNKPDRDRIKEVGPDRACAEWLLRCGATVRWKGMDTFIKDYNTLPAQQGKHIQSYVIEEIDAVEAGIMNVGFDHFDGCTHIRRVRFHHLPYFEDSTLEMLVDKLKGSLEHLKITSCGDITDSGLSYMTRLNLLKSLVLQDLPEVRDKQKCYNLLKTSLPQCDIDYKDLSNVSK